MEYLHHQNLERRVRNTLTLPFIYVVAFPLVFMDIILEIYHRVCFPLYDLDLVDRSAYIKIDRHKLQYLSPKQKLNCAYCGYVNGLFAYWVRIAAETEKYWCGIQHETEERFRAPEHHREFVRYNDEGSFKRMYQSSISAANKKGSHSLE